MLNSASLAGLNNSQKQHIANLLARLIETLDLSDTQYERIQSAYHGVGTYLADSDDPLLEDTKIYPQGSVSLNTTVKPKNKEQYDIDLICYLPNASRASGDDVLKAIQKRLEDHGTYKHMLSPLARGFRINYAADYHLDITPGKDYPRFAYGESHPLWVTDTKCGWKESNPSGYAGWFVELSKKLPIRRMLAVDQLYKADSMESIEPLPDHTQKKLLNRIVQILKRHRDEWAFDQGEKAVIFKPISAIITTLSAHAYWQICSEKRVYDNDLDIIIDVLSLLPSFIAYDGSNFTVLNPAMQEENFAEKWNIREESKGEKLSSTFYAWHQAAFTSFELIASSVGEDVLMDNLQKSFGENPVQSMRNTLMEKFNHCRKNNTLGVTAGIGSLTAVNPGITGKPAIPSQPIPANTFYGSQTGSTITVKKNTFFGR